MSWASILPRAVSTSQNCRYGVGSAYDDLAIATAASHRRQPRGYGAAVWDGGHIKFFSIATLGQLLTEAGFRDIRSSALAAFRCSPSRWQWCARVAHDWSGSIVRP
jgi:hypothetical protein